jgi:hypothetical protein
MDRRGVSYDVGRVLGLNWRPDFDAAVVRRELQIIRDDLHCNAVRICGREIARLVTAATAATELGLEVWFSPELWNKSPRQTLAHIAQAAAAAEALRKRHPDLLVFVVGSELTLFMQGIIPGASLNKRLRNAFTTDAVKKGTHNRPLNAFLGETTERVRRVFGGPLTYASLPWETVDWSLFDFVGLDHYRDARIRERYVAMLEPLLAVGKPVVVTEVGWGTCRAPEGSGPDAEPRLGGILSNAVDNRTLLLHSLPLVGRFVRPHLKVSFLRDEACQAAEVGETLAVLDGAGVAGAFVFTFVAPIFGHSAEPRYDLDMVSASLVKTYADGRHGQRYPGMPWEPKRAFQAVADYYGKDDEASGAAPTSPDS